MVEPTLLPTLASRIFRSPLPRFRYTNTHPFRPDLAQFTHLNCPGRGAQRTGSKSKSGKARPSPPSIC